MYRNNILLYNKRAWGGSLPNQTKHKIASSIVAVRLEGKIVHYFVQLFVFFFIRIPLFCLERMI